MARLDNRKRRSLSGKSANLPNNYFLTIDKPDFASRFSQFNQIWEEELDIALENAAKAGVNRAAKTLDETGTPPVGNGGEWGKARMSGERWGVSFRPYGNSEGRNDTGTMIDSLTWDLVKSNGRKSARFGWLKRFEDYFYYQEFGFRPTRMFDRDATQASGIAQFKPRGGMQKVPGARSLEAGYKLVESIIDSFFSQAWNRSRERWQSGGRKSSPGTYLGARERFRRASNL